MSTLEKQLVVVTGLSGAGKSIALNTFEDMGFFCIDNLPICLGEELAKQLQANKKGMERLALAVDGRSFDFFQQWAAFMALFAELEHSFSLLYLAADEEVLLRRFSQMRRIHPLATVGGDAVDGIRLELSHTKEVRDAADVVIDTSSLTPTELRALLLSRFGGEDHVPQLPVRVLSFGFKRGVPAEADLVFDVRFLPNPYFVEHLRACTGKDAEVATYVLDTAAGSSFFALLTPMLSFLIPHYLQGGKMSLTIAIGCTGGKHRSVAVAEELAVWLQDQPVQLRLSHRDIGME